MRFFALNSVRLGGAALSAPLNMPRLSNCHLGVESFVNDVGTALYFPLNQHFLLRYLNIRSWSGRGGNSGNNS